MSGFRKSYWIQNKKKGLFLIENKVSPTFNNELVSFGSQDIFLGIFKNIKNYAKF